MSWHSLDSHLKKKFNLSLLILWKNMHPGYTVFNVWQKACLHTRRLRTVPAEARSSVTTSSLLLAPTLRWWLPTWQKTTTFIQFIDVFVAYYTHNRPYSYSRYWTGSSMKWRLLRGNLFICKCIPPQEPPLHARSSSIPRIRIWPISNYVSAELQILVQNFPSRSWMRTLVCHLICHLKTDHLK